MEVATGALSTLLPKLRQLLQGEYNLQKATKKDIDLISRELQGIQAALRNVDEVPREELKEQVGTWTHDVKEVSYDMEDIVDNFLVRVPGPEPPSKRNAERFVKKMINMFAKATTQQEIDQKIKDIKESVREVAERHDRNRCKIDAFAPAKISVDPRITAPYTKVTELVGIHEAKEEVITRLIKGDEQERIVSIAGFGGLGKTTLAKAVYEEIKGQFDCTAFVSASRNPDTKKLLKDIMYELDKEKFKNSHSIMLDEKHLIDLVIEFLRDKRYLIVLDDIWDIKLWEVIQHALLENGLKSIIITTTRILDVAEQVGGCYKLKPLTHESSKILFYGRIFGSKGKFPRQFSEVSEKILKKCGGVPLAIITVSSLLANKSGDIKEWYDVCNSIGSGLQSNPGMDNIRKILLLSYYDLPSHLKVCLLYLSIFPEDYEIRTDRLIWKWIAEDFVQHGEGGQSLFELGESYFHELVNRSLIQPTRMNDEGMPWACRVHDMVLDLICSLSREENFVTTISGDTKQNTPAKSKVRRLALHNSNEEHSLGDNMVLSHLRSLNAIGCPTYMIPPVSRFLLLRVLDLESCGSLEGYNLEHLGKLLVLRFIGLRNTIVHKLPEEIGHLKFLQTLELEGSGVEELPSSMDVLTRLMCLNADWTTRVPNWIGKLTSLHQLVMYPGYYDDENSARWFVKELRNLGELRVLRFLIRARDEGQLRDLLESLSHLKKIEVIQFDYYGLQLNNRGVFLEPTDLALSKTLRFLELCWLEFSRRPSWINPQDLANLHHLWLMVFDVEKRDLEILGALPVLRHLHLVILNTKQGEIITSDSGTFKNLKFCNITKPLKFVHGAMPRLEVLDFHFNVRLLRDANRDFDFDFGLGNLPSLRQVIVQINCLAASSMEVEKAEAAQRDAVSTHVNHPTIEISLFGQRMDADLKILSPKIEKKDDPRDELISWMISMVDNDVYSKKIKILPIVRSQGPGNTTLAQEVFHKLSPQFDCGAFVHVGQNANLRKVFTDIVIGLDEQKYKDFPMMGLELMDLIGLLRKSLINKRFFVVVDDIWDLKTWDMMKCAFIENSNGSVVLTTTSRQNWGSMNWKTNDDKWDFDGTKQSPPHSITDHRKLFYKKIFGSEDKCPAQLKDVCEKLVATCDGMLSVIIETVELLASVPWRLEDWPAVYDRRILALSYSDLPDHLRNCLLYFSMFRKGYEISGERLVWAWIAEGFVQGTEGQTLEELGEIYLGELVRRKMIEAVEVDAGGKALSCRAYGLVHDFIISKSEEANFAAILLQDSLVRDLPDTVHRLSIQGDTHGHGHYLPQAWLSQVRSLVASSDTVPPLSCFQDLRVLDLGECDSLNAFELRGINNSTSLKYMAIGSKSITDIPNEITKLKHLQTLDLSASDLNKLPGSVLLLKHLERLWVNSQMDIPDGIAEMSALQVLGDVNITRLELLKKLRKLSKLRVLRIAIWSWDESLENFGEQLWNNLCLLLQFGQSVLSLSILTCCSLEFMYGSGENLAPNSLQKLDIRYSAFDRLPRWFCSLPNISSLTIEVYKLSQDIIYTLGKLPTLHSLSLTSQQVPEGYFFIDSDIFKNLASLKFASNAMAENIFAPQGEATQQLKSLTIVFQASRTQDINKDFSFGLENLCSSLQQVRVEIICLNASHQMVDNAEAAIRVAISRNCSSHPDLEIRRVQEECMIEEMDFR